jgi:hypothetical protein
MFPGATCFGLVTMKYSVEGADKTTGDDREIIISAESIADARNKASAMGILVSNVQARESESDGPIAKPSKNDLLNELEETELLTPKAPRRETPPPSLPEYTGLKFASNVLGFLGVFSYVVGVFAWLTYADDGAGGAGFFIFLSLLIGGTMQLGMAAACVALRDIARNSFGR